jgi:hypothetical protein
MVEEEVAVGQGRRGRSRASSGLKSYLDDHQIHFVIPTPDA